MRPSEDWRPQVGLGSARSVVLCSGLLACLLCLAVWVLSIWVGVKYVDEWFSLGVARSRIHFVCFEGSAPDRRAFVLNHVKGGAGWSIGSVFRSSRWRQRESVFDELGLSWIDTLESGPLWFGGARINQRVIAIPIWMPITIAATGTFVLYWTGRGRRPVGHCADCGYNLTGNVSGRCPECGALVGNQETE